MNSILEILESIGLIIPWTFNLLMNGLAWCASNPPQGMLIIFAIGWFAVGSGAARRMRRRTWDAICIFSTIIFLWPSIKLFWRIRKGQVISYDYKDRAFGNDTEPKKIFGTVDGVEGDIVVVKCLTEINQPFFRAKVGELLYSNIRHIKKLKKYTNEEAVAWLI